MTTHPANIKEKPQPPQPPASPPLPIPAVDTARGLSADEAAGRLASEGGNELPTKQRRGALRQLWGVVSEPMILLLLGCGTIYFLVGDRQEALILLGFVLVVLVISYLQERRAENSLQALRDLSSPRALVLRDGQPRRIPGREVVRGDVLLLQDGDRVAADAVLCEAAHLAVDESLLTGESVPVQKGAAAAADTPLSAPGSEPQGGEGAQGSSVYSGSLVVRGHGTAVVHATGARTALGRIGKALASVTEVRSPLQVELGRLVRVTTVVGLSLCAVVVVVYGLRRGDWLKGFLSGLTLAMSVLPEEVPMILTLFMAIGAHRIAKQKVLTRRMDAIETLGSATVLCVDKTGTLTMNRMALVEARAGQVVRRLQDGPDAQAGSSGALEPALQTLLRAAAQASAPQAGDPMDQALRARAAQHEQAWPPADEAWQVLREYPLTRERLALGLVWGGPEGARRVAIKGAPEALGALCHLDPEELLAQRAEAEQMAAAGLRVLAVAHVPEAGAAPEGIEDPQALPWTWLGLVGLADPVRPEVPAALQECRDAGVRVVMITGDYPATAQSIARDIGLVARGEEARLLTGPELDELTDEALAQRVIDTSLFARVVPEQKLRLVQALQRSGAVVAMTGDGVNDAPALKAAHIGVAMGARGTDVAREAAALTLVDDDFAALVKALRLGRRIYDNLRSAIAYTMAVHVPIAGLSLVPVLMGWPLMLLPVHIALMEMIIDPACSLVFEAQAGDPQVMRRPPRPPGEPLLTRRLLWVSLLQGLVVLASTLLVCGLSLRLGLGETRARALTFGALMAANLGLILTNLSHRLSIVRSLRRDNRALWWLLGAATALCAVVFASPFLQRLLSFSRLRPLELLLTLSVGAFSVLWFEVLKRLTRDRPATTP